MPRKTRHETPGDEEAATVEPRKRKANFSDEPSMPRTTGFDRNKSVKEDFARRLRKALVREGINQSEAARRADLQRDSVSAYVNARRLPEPPNLKRLADALHTTPEELLPMYAGAEIASNETSLDVKASTERPGQAWLRINRLVSLGAAVKITEILVNDKLDEK